jgi:hypothetical protein
VIDPNWNVIDLDPTTWRNLGRFIDPGQYVLMPRSTSSEPELYVLHDRGRVLKVHDTHAGPRRDLSLARIDDPQETARALFATENWARVHVVDKQHLASVARAAQQIENRALTLDAYYHLVSTELWREPTGYVCQPPRPPTWNGWTYADALAFVRCLPDPATVALGVLENDSIYIGLILEIRGGLIRTVTTFEALILPQPLPLAKASLDVLARAVSAKFAPLAAVLVCDRDTFEGWLNAGDKSAFLQNAAGQRKAFWRLPSP